MSQNLGLSSNNLEQVKQTFIGYLEGSAPSTFIGEALNIVLRVEEPIYFPAKDVAQIVADWALLRSYSDGYLVHEYYIKSIELIAAADHSKVLTAFDPTRFFMPYFEGLVRNCPKEEKEAFKYKLKILREKLASEWGYQFRRTDANTTTASHEAISINNFPSEPTSNFSIKQPNPNRYTGSLEEPVSNYAATKEPLTSFSPNPPSISNPSNASISRENISAYSIENTPSYPPSIMRENLSPNYPPPSNAAPNYPPPSNAAPNYPPSGNAAPNYPPSGNAAPNYPPSGNAAPNYLPPSNAAPNYPPPSNAAPNYPPPSNAAPTNYPNAPSYPGNVPNYPVATPPANYPGNVPNYPPINPASSYPGVHTPSYPTPNPYAANPYAAPSVAEPPPSYPSIAPPPANYSSPSLPTSWGGQAKPSSAVKQPSMNVNNLSINEVIFDMGEPSRGNNGGNYMAANPQPQSYGQSQATPEFVSAVLHRLRMSIFKLSPQDQENYVAEIQRLLFEMLQRRTYITPYLEAVVDISLTTFNAGQGLFGAQLLYIVEQIYYSDGFDANIRTGLRRFRTATELSEQYVRSMASNPDLASALRIYLAHFDELSPEVLLSNMFCETDRQKQRFWMLLIETHKETATNYIVQGLSQITPNPDNWSAIRNLIALLGRVPPQERLTQRQAISVLGPYLKSPYIQLRYATLTTLESFVTDEALPHLIAVFDEKLYVNTELEDPDRLFTYFKTILTLLGKFNSERAVKLLAEISIGKYISFINTKSVQNLQLQAMQLLTSKRNLLSSNVIAPIVEKIRNVTNPWKKLLTSRFWSGDDELELLAMIEVVGMFNTPEIRELLTDIKDRYANQPPGRRANEILARL